MEIKVFTVFIWQTLQRFFKPAINIDHLTETSYLNDSMIAKK